MTQYAISNPEPETRSLPGVVPRPDGTLPRHLGGI